ATGKHDRAAKRGLDRREDVEPVDDQGARAKFGGRASFCQPRITLGVGASRSTHGVSLALGQLPAVADQLERRGRSIVTRQQPAEIRRGPPKQRDARRVKRGGIVRIRSSMGWFASQVLDLLSTTGGHGSIFWKRVATANLAN